MSKFVPEKVFVRGVPLHYFNMKKTAAESHRILVEVYGEHALAERTCQIFHYDNARAHVAIPVKDYLENSGWEVLPHPPYSPDLAPSDNHLFRSMENALTGIRFTSEQGIKNWLDSFLVAKPV